MAAREDTEDNADHSTSEEEEGAIDESWEADFEEFKQSLDEPAEDSV